MYARLPLFRFCAAASHSERANTSANKLHVRLIVHKTRAGQCCTTYDFHKSTSLPPGASSVANCAGGSFAILDRQLCSGVTGRLSLVCIVVAGRLGLLKEAPHDMPFGEQAALAGGNQWHRVLQSLELRRCLDSCVT